MRTSLRAAPAVAVLLGFYAAAVGAVAALAFVAVHVVLDAGSGPATAVTLGLLAAAVLVATAVSATLRRPAVAPVGLLLEPENHPDLWVEVRELAERVGTRAPDEIRLVPEPTVSIGEDVGRLGLVAGTRRLALGVPLLLTLSRGEVHALVAHELAHHRGGTFGIAAVAWRGQQTLGELAARERQNPAVAALVQACTRLYLRVAHGANRRHEIEADEVAARIAGTHATIAALRQVPAVELLWQRYADDHAFAAPGLRPLRLFEGFAELWAQPEVQVELTRVRDEPAAPTLASYDAHPALEERLDLLFDHRVEAPVDDTPAARMITRAGWHAVELETTMFRLTDLRTASWEEIADVAARHQVHAEAARATERLDQAISDLDGGRARVLTAHLLPDDATDGEVRDRAVTLVTAVLESALLDQGSAHVVPSWRTAWLLVDDEGKSLDVAPTVAAALDDDETRDALLAFVRSEGLAAYRAQPLGTAKQPEHLHGLMSGRRGTTPLVVAVTDGGVLLSPHDDGPGRAGAHAALETVSARGLSALVSSPQARLVRWGDILEARPAARDAALTLRLVSGEKVNVSTGRGRTLGEPEPALAQYLGERYLGALVGAR